MIRMIHCVTGVEMWVHESNVAEYVKRGHKVAPVVPLSKKPEKKPVKRTAKKAR